jgi:uncharacterized protein (UPF0216 family)
MKVSHCTDCTALTEKWHKTIMQILKVLSKHLPRNTKQTSELQPEDVAGGTVAAGGLFSSLLR